jgi:transposase
LGIMIVRHLHTVHELLSVRDILNSIGKGSIVAKVQKVSTKEFKEEAVKLVQSSGKPIAQVVRELGVSDSAIHQWQKQLTEKGPDAFPGTGHQNALEEENRRLKRELEIARQERDILKNSYRISP